MVSRVLTERSKSLVCRARSADRQPWRSRRRFAGHTLGQRSGEEGTDSLTFYRRGRTIRIHVEVSVFHYLWQRSLISGTEPVGVRDRRVSKIRFCEGDIRKDQLRKLNHNQVDLQPSNNIETKTGVLICIF